MAFVALAIIGLAAAGMNSGPHYEAFLNVPGEAAFVQPEEGSDQATPQNGTQAEGAPEDGGEQASEDGRTAVTDAAPEIDLSAIPASEEVSAFSAAGGSAPPVSQASLDSISDAFSQLTDGGIDAGFVFMNMETGAGIAANADQKVYGASSIKGPFVTYICEKLIDGGTITADTKCISMTDSFKRNGSTSVENLVESTIAQSSNGSFAGLREEYGGSKYAEWLESLGVDADIHEGGDWFAWYTARDAAKLWSETYDYLGSGSQTSDWLRGLMEETNVSYIRDGAASLKVRLVEEQEWKMPAMQSSPTKLIKATADSVSGYRDVATVLDNVTVANKAGWCVSDSGSTVDYDSTSDNGIITIDGRDYLLCIMTGAPYSDRSAGNVSNLAASLIASYDQVA